MILGTHDNLTLLPRICYRSAPDCIHGKALSQPFLLCHRSNRAKRQLSLTGALAVAEFADLIEYDLAGVVE